MPAETGLSPTEATGFRKAAELGHAAAQMMLGARHLVAGVTGEPLPDKHRVGLERAVAQGMTEAERIYCRLTRNNLAKSSRKV